jgi:hypothetical protein
MTGAMGFVPDSVKRDDERDRHRRKQAAQRSAWGV